MADYPSLKTGARCQFPFRKHLRHQTVVLEFLDGSEQRFSRLATATHAWTLPLTNLDGFEAYTLATHFRDSQGCLSPFVFVDPISGATHSACFFQRDQVEFTIAGEHDYRITVEIEEQ